MRSEIGAEASVVLLGTLRWRDVTGNIHAVDGEHVHPGETLLWTRCGLHDIPDGASLQSNGALTCQACRIGADMDPSLDPPPP